MLNWVNSMTTKILVGPPGTGKTTRLMSILEEELKTVDSTRIAFVTFTREGANQGITRAVEKTGLPKDSFPFFRTLHSLAFKQAEASKDMLMDRSEYRELSKAMGMNFIGHYSEDLKHDDDRYLGLFELERNNKKMFQTKIFDYETYKYKYVAMNYTKYKQTFKKIDYTDLIERFISDDTPINVDVAIIDEAQDLTSLQWAMAHVAFRNCKRVYIAGDDDQSIFQWSGADVEEFINHEGEQIVLTQSYRLPDEVLAFAKTISKRIFNRIDKDYHGTGPGGSITRFSTVYQLSSIRQEDSWLLLSRNNSYLSVYEEMLQSRGILYYLKGEPSIKRKDIEALNLFSRLSNGGKLDEVELYRLEENLNKRYDIKDGWEICFNWTKTKKAYIKVWIENGMKDESFIKINTIHTSKGAEAENVAVLLDISSNVYKNFQMDPDAENRAFYVAFTRAKKNLFIIRSNSKYEYPA